MSINRRWSCHNTQSGPWERNSHSSKRVQFRCFYIICSQHTTIAGVHKYTKMPTRDPYSQILASFLGCCLPVQKLTQVTQPSVTLGCPLPAPCLLAATVRACLQLYHSLDKNSLPYTGRSAGRVPFICSGCCLAAATAAAASRACLSCRTMSTNNWCLHGSNGQRQQMTPTHTWCCCENIPVLLQCWMVAKPLFSETLQVKGSVVHSPPLRTETLLHE